MEEYELKTPTSQVGGDQGLPPGSRDRDRDLSLDSVPAVSLAVRELTVAVRAGSRAFYFSPSLRRKSSYWSLDEEGNRKPQKKILNSVSADFPSGQLTAILGASGSGKSSLLNVLADRMNNAKLDIAGEISFNGSPDRAGIESAYCLQQDVLSPTLTIRETLRYAADLRLRGDISKAERWRIVNEVIIELSLKEAADTRLKFCSGGEKRRTSLAIQLLANPSVLWCDEVTTGLDATSAMQLVTTLRALARKGRTVILTIHQPRSEIWTLFDRVVLLSQGEVMYAGESRVCTDYFRDLGFPLPSFCNPAEYIIDLAAVDNRTREFEKLSQTRVNILKTEWKLRSLDMFAKSWDAHAVLRPVRLITSSSRRAANGVSFARQVHVQSSRTLRISIRDPLGFVGSFVQAILMGIAVGWIFFQLDGSLAGIRGRMSAIYVAVGLQGYLVLMYETFRMTMDIQLFDRERSEGVVSIPAWLLSRRIAKFPEDLAVSVFFTVPFYFMTGFRVDFLQYLIFFLVVFIEQFNSVGLAIASVAISRDLPIASLISNLVFTFQTFSCGFFVVTASMPVYVKWCRWVSYVYYGFGALCTNEFKDRHYDCPEQGGSSNPACLPYSGNFQLQSLSFPSKDWIWRPLVILVAFAVFHLLLAGIILWINKQEMKVVKKGKAEQDRATGKENIPNKAAGDGRTVKIRLEDYRINVSRRTRQGLKLTKRQISILKPVNATFTAGTLNVIMGPSGSGKTSLLSSLANRIKNDFLSRYDVQGKLLINGSELKHPELLNSIISYVTQEDDALLPSMTVRETLQFAAGLRLPKWMTKEEKHQRAEEVLLQMGLKDCAGLRIGSDQVKGISGGEKRRVTISVQLLSAPRVLLLDEPTSGLDAYTSSSIMQVLQSLAQTGTTIIMTVHQSRSDLWTSFGNILLLARGGHPVYAGPRDQMLDHFARQGYDCPKTTNPADFALDLITVDLRDMHQEAATREKVQSLINHWNNTSTLSLRRTSSVIATPTEIGALQKTKAPFLTSFPIVVHRSFLNLWRQPPLIIGRIMQVLGLGILATFFFAPLKKDFYSVQTRLGFVQEICPVYFVGMLNNIAIYPFEQAVFYREYDDRAYNVEAFILQYTVLELPFEILTALLFAVLADLAAGLPRTVPAFFITAFNVFCIVNCGESLGILFNTLLSHTGFAVNVMSMFISVAQIMGGTMAIDMPSFLQAFNYLSPIKYAIQSLAYLSFSGIEFGCLDSQHLPDGKCPVQHGADVLKMYKLDMPLWLSITALGVVTVGYRIVAYVVLKAKKEKWYSFARSR